MSVQIFFPRIEILKVTQLFPDLWKTGNGLSLCIVMLHGIDLIGIAVLHDFVVVLQLTCIMFLIVFRENLAQIIQAGQRVIDNPVYISDLGM